MARAGLEPASLAAQASKTCVYANSTTEPTGSPKPAYALIDPRKRRAVACLGSALTATAANSYEIPEHCSLHPAEGGSGVEPAAMWKYLGVLGTLLAAGMGLPIPEELPI